MKILSYLLTFVMLFAGTNVWAADDGNNGGSTGGNTGGSTGGTGGTGGDSGTNNGGSTGNGTGNTGNKGGELSTDTQKPDNEKIEKEKDNSLEFLLIAMFTGNPPIRRAPHRTAQNNDADVVIQYNNTHIIVTFNSNLGIGNCSLTNTQTGEVYEEEVVAVPGQTLYYSVDEPSVMKFSAEFCNAEGLITWEM